MIAVIESGSKQYLVEPGQTIRTELVGDGVTTLEFEPLMVIDGDKVEVGTPRVTGTIVKASVAAEELKGDKIRVLKYKAKKRQKTMQGHRQRYSVLTIESIA
jgi:large subunit ribosomal protein L21